MFNNVVLAGKADLREDYGLLAFVNFKKNLRKNQVIHFSSIKRFFGVVVENDGPIDNPAKWAICNFQV